MNPLPQKGTAVSSMIMTVGVGVGVIMVVTAGCVVIMPGRCGVRAAVRIQTLFAMKH